MIATPSQKRAVAQIRDRLEVWSSVCLTGRCQSGRTTTYQLYCEQYGSSYKEVITFDHDNYSSILSKNVNHCSVRKAINSILGSIREDNTLLILEDFSSFISSCDGYSVPGRSLCMKAIESIPRRLPKDCHLLILCSEDNHHLHLSTITAVDLRPAEEDFRALVVSSGIPSSAHTHILRSFRKMQLGKLVQALQYTKRKTSPETVAAATSTDKDHQDRRALEPENERDLILNYHRQSERHSREEIGTLEHFQKAIEIIGSGSLNSKLEVVKPHAPLNMIGLEEICRQIDINVIKPFNDQNLNVPAAQGIILHGPPGTGKSTIGRWLSHLLPGRFYMLEEDPSVSFSENLRSTMKRAADNAPSVLFIDDIDSLLLDESNLRSMLTALDGVNCKGRESICIIATCMDLGRVSSALLRGGRLEISIRFNKPDANSLALALERNISFICGDRNDKAISPLRQLSRNSAQIKDLSIAMTDWNFSDVSRCVNTVFRTLLWREDNDERETDTALAIQLFRSTIVDMSQQQNLCMQVRTATPCPDSYFI